MAAATRRPNPSLSRTAGAAALRAAAAAALCAATAADLRTTAIADDCVDVPQSAATPASATAAVALCACPSPGLPAEPQHPWLCAWVMDGRQRLTDLLIDVPRRRPELKRLRRGGEPTSRVLCAAFECGSPRACLLKKKTLSCGELAFRVVVRAGQVRSARP